MTLLKKSDEEKLMALHYIHGIDFPILTDLLHEPLYPSQKENTLSKDSPAQKLTHQDIHLDRRPQHQRG